MPSDMKLAHVLGLHDLVSGNHDTFGPCTVTGCLVANISAFAAFKAGPPRRMSYPERYKTENVRSSMDPIQANCLLHSLLILSCYSFIAVVSVFLSLSLVNMP